MAKRKNATSAQIVFAWELAQKPFIIPIPRTTKLHHLEKNLSGADIELSASELKEINDTLTNLDIDETHFQLKKRGSKNNLSLSFNYL